MSYLTASMHASGDAALRALARTYTNSTALAPATLPRVDLALPATPQPPQRTQPLLASAATPTAAGAEAPHAPRESPAALPKVDWVVTGPVPDPPPRLLPKTTRAT